MPDEKKPTKTKAEPPADDEPAGSSEPQGEGAEPVDPRFVGEEYEARQLSEEK